MKLQFLSAAAAAAAGLMLCACSPISTRVDPPVSEPTAHPKVDGLTYYLPLQSVIVTLVVDKKSKPDRKITVSTTGTYADHSHRFVANYHANQLGTNAINIKIDANGLLNGDVTSTLTPKVGDVLNALASDFGYFAGKRIENSVQASVAGGTPCDGDDTYVWVVPLAATDKADDGDRRAYAEAQALLSACKISFDATPLFAPVESSAELKTQHDSDGLFYRQAVPYLLKVTDTGSNTTQSHFVALPTHDAPTEFLPAQRSLFAASTFGATFAAGTPTAYSQTADSEWLGVVSIPAAVLKSYASAVTDAFKDKEGVDAEHVKALLAQQKLQACVAAVKTNVQASIDAACQ